MKFKVIPNVSHFPSEGRSIAYLWSDNWNDYWDFQTLYVLKYFDEDGIEHDIGGVKIGQFSWHNEQRRPHLPDQFENLDDRFFSLGQDADYYEKLRELGPDLSHEVLSALNDIAADKALFLKAKDERVVGVSLMRSVNERTINGQFYRIINGGARLTSYAFNYLGPAQLNNNFNPIELEFLVEPFSKPPTNIQIIIGRNGVGKSFFLNAMSRALVYPDESVEQNGKFTDPNDWPELGFHNPFANIVSLTFSAFDDFPIIQKKRNTLKGIRYSNVGLRKLVKPNGEEGECEWSTETQDPNKLASDFIASAKVCASGDRSKRWQRALRTLESDPIFKEAEVASLLDFKDLPFSREAGRLFRRLSSGHKIVLLTITKLVEEVEERTLVLMDEPEAHLHPPLLSALVRALSDLLIDRNGVAIVATHSPVC